MITSDVHELVEWCESFQEVRKHVSMSHGHRIRPKPSNSNNVKDVFVGRTAPIKGRITFGHHSSFGLISMTYIIYWDLGPVSIRIE